MQVANDDREGRQHPPQPVDDRRRRPATLMRRCAFALVGASPDDLSRLSDRTQLKLAALGLAFGIGLVLLLAAWIHVGWTYFGWFGVLVPGVAVPMAMVLGLDRLIAMQTRPLRAELAPYNPPVTPEEAAERRNQKLVRLVMAMVFSAITTYTLLLSFSQDGIRQSQRNAANAANAQLRQTHEQRLNTEHDLRDSMLEKRLQDLQDERSQLSMSLAEADAAAKSSDKSALQARDEAAQEAGGLAGKATGYGPRYKAQRDIEAHHQAAAAQQSSRALQLRQRIDQLDREVTGLQQQRATLRAQTDLAMAAVPESIRSDPKYAPVKSGLFADSSAFIHLYSDPDEGTGHWVMTLLLTPFLFCLEMLPLLALALYGSSPLDVLRIAENRAEAAGVAAEAELLIARRRAALNPVGLAYPRRPQAPAAGLPDAAQVAPAVPPADNGAVENPENLHAAAQAQQGLDPNAPSLAEPPNRDPGAKAQVTA